jgi:hypothetical protein
MFLSIYVTSVIVGGGAAFWISGAPGLALSPLPVLFWILANMLGEVLWLPAPKGRGYLSMATAANFTSILILPTPLAILVTGSAGVLVDVLFRRRRWYKVLFNAGMCALSVSASSRILSSFGWVNGSLEHLLSPLEIGAVLLSAGAYFLLNTWLVTGAIALQQRESAWRIWRQSFAFGYELLGSFMLFLLGLYFAVLLLTWGYLSAFIATITTYFVRDAYCRFLSSLEHSARARAAP